MTHTSWNEMQIDRLLAVEATGPGCWRTQHGDANLNGRSYGGQLLGQAMMAGLTDIPEGRQATMMQFLFLQGAVPEETVELRVTKLQDGKRFSSRNVRGTQGNGRVVLDAQVTGAVTMDSPEHETPTSAPKGESPQDLPTLDDINDKLRRGIRPLGGYSEDRKPSIEFRIPYPDRQFETHCMNGRFRFWMRAAQALPDDLRVHACVFAYMSDWWLNFSALGLHLGSLNGRSLYIVSLNHAIWLHRQPRADEWMHVEAVSPASGAGRGLSVGSVHDAQGRHMATLTQECLMAYAD